MQETSDLGPTSSSIVTGELDSMDDNADFHVGGRRPDLNVKVESDSFGGSNNGNGSATGNATGAYRADHGSSFVPGAGPEHLAPKSLDHFKRGYEERAAQRDKEFYTVGSGTGVEGNTSSNGSNAKGTETGTTESTVVGPSSGTGVSTPPSAGKQPYVAPPQPQQHQAEHSQVGSYGRGSTGGHSTYRDEEEDNYRHPVDNLSTSSISRGGSVIGGSSRYGRGGHGVGSFSVSGGGSGNRDLNNNGRDYGSNNGTGFGGRGGAGARGGTGGIGSRRYMDDPWGYRDRPTVLQGLDINAMMDRLAELSHDTEKLFAELDRVRDEYKQIFDTGKAMTALISVAARRKQIGLGHAVWDWMDLAKLHKNTFHYNSMISVAEKAKNYQQALDLLNEMTDRNIPKNEVTFSSAISACEKCGQWKIALDLLNSMEDEGVARTAIAYNAAISACEKGMVPQKACEVFQRMKRENIAPSVVSYSALISAAEKGSQWKLALEILEEMKEEGFHGNVVAYSAAISALAKGQQWRKALELFREIQSHGGTPSIVTYNATMTALEKGMQWERALDLFEEMKMRNLPITVVSYGSAISACDKGFQYRQCLEFLDEMTEMGIPKNVIIFGAAMSCMEKCSRADIGFQLMKRMKEEGIAPNVHIYNSAISACARCNLWEKGYELFQEMDQVGVRKDVVTYNAVLDAVACQIRLGRMLFEEGVQKGFYAKVSRLGEHWFELDLHFLSLGGGEIALGWWFEECLVPYLVNTEKLKNVKSISIVTGYGKTRTRGRRFGDDGMRKRCKAMLQFMNIQELSQPNAGRIHVDKESLIAEVNKNGGKVIFDLDGYTHWKENETTANAAPDTPQMIRARFKPQVLGSGRPPFTRVENEHTTPEYRLENQKKRGFYVDDKPVASVFDDMDDVPVPDDTYDEHPDSFRGSAGSRGSGEDHRKSSFRVSGGRGLDDNRGIGGGGGERSFGDSRNDGRSFQSIKSEYRDHGRGARTHGENKRMHNDDMYDRGIHGKREFVSEKETLNDRRIGSGRSSWREENSNSNHYGPPEVKNEAGQYRRGGYDEPPRDYPPMGKDNRFEERSSRVPTHHRRYNNNSEDRHYNPENERKGTKYLADDEIMDGPFRSGDNRIGDLRRSDREVQIHSRSGMQDTGNKDFGRSQRSYDNEYLGGSSRNIDDSVSNQRYRNNDMGNRHDNSYRQLPPSREFRRVDDRVNLGRERVFDSFDQPLQQHHDNDPRKRGYDEPDRRPSTVSRGYTLEPQSQKRRLS